VPYIWIHSEQPRPIDLGGRLRCSCASVVFEACRLDLVVLCLSLLARTLHSRDVSISRPYVVQQVLCRPPLSSPCLPPIECSFERLWGSVRRLINLRAGIQ
jgi:hypothetical protein